MAFLELKQITKRFSNAQVIENFNLSIEQGKMVTLLGPSGCGKTTILRLIAGLETTTSGQILLENREITHSAPQHRDIGIVFQSYALFPHLTIGENVGFSLKMEGVPKAERLQRVKEALALVELEGFEDRFIDQISGGQQQRVALARALILKPKILLFDEPLSNLDSNLRHAMREKIRTLQQQLNITALYVTHDQSEAFAVSDEIVVMNKGKIVQQGSPEQLYTAPVNQFIANFMGEASFLPAQKLGNQIQLGDLHLMMESDIPDGECLLGIRPEAISLTACEAGNFSATLRKADYMGAYWELELEWLGKSLTAFVAPTQFDRCAHHYRVALGREGVFVLPNMQE